MWEILSVPLIACVVLTGIHCYLGIHVVMREVIFVDLALAQMAALGAAVGMLAGFSIHSPFAYFSSLLLTLIGAAVFALGRFRRARVPQEAVIGIVFAVSAALTILILSQSAVEPAELENMLVGRLLFVTGTEVAKTTLIYAAVALVHIPFRRTFFSISTSAAGARRSGINVPLWDFIFYATFGLVVTSSVQMAGVLLVFSYLVVPAVCAMMLFGTIASRLIGGWLFGLLASAGGLAVSAAWDLPTGAAVVAAFGAMWVLCSMLYALRPAARPT